METVIEVAARDVGAALLRHGIEPDETVRITIEPELIPGRRETRKLVVTAGLTDDDIDVLIDEARRDAMNAVDELLPVNRLDDVVDRAEAEALLAKVAARGIGQEGLH